MTRAQPGRLSALAETCQRQSEVLVDWLRSLPAATFARSSVLEGWDVRTLVGHLVLVQEGLLRQLATRADGPATPVAQFVRRYRRDVAQLEQRTRDVTDDLSPDELLARLSDTPDVVPAVADLAPTTVLDASRGPITAVDWLRTRIVELVVHSDDLSRSLPEFDPVPLTRPALAAAVRLLAEILAAQAPGRSVELRVPPFVAVQAVPGPRHTRGTPPNVIETDAVTWVRLATGRTSWAEALAAARVTASGSRADLTDHLPVMS